MVAGYTQYNGKEETNVPIFLLIKPPPEVQHRAYARMSHGDMNFITKTKPGTTELFLSVEKLLSSNELPRVICIYWRIDGLYNHFARVKAEFNLD